MDELTRLFLEARDGDRLALAQWIRKSQPDVWRLTSHLIDRHEADDLTQEVFLRALSSMHSFRGESSPRTWLLSITRNVCADTVRRRQRARLLTRSAPIEAPSNLDETAAANDLIGRLEPSRREAFVLTQIIGLSYAEAAAVCRCPVGTIRSRVARARADLIEALRSEDLGKLG
jgi:RNA polymerase sigma-70 factor (ECF subfamily)